MSIPKLKPGSNIVGRYWFKPEEAGVYTVKVLYLYTPSGAMQPSDIEGGFAAADFRGPEVTYGIILAIPTALVALLTLVKRKKTSSTRRRRRA